VTGAPPDRVDVAIVGGGMVGASLALALGDLPCHVALIEAVAADSAAQPSFDLRTTALANGSRRVYETLGVWQELESAATPIRRIHVSEQGAFGQVRLDAREQGLDSLGFVVENRELGRALWRRLEQLPRLVRLAPARVLDAEIDARAAVLTVSDARGTHRIEAALLVAADGADSLIRQRSGVAAERRDYRQTAIVTTVVPERFHDYVAYERFSDQGPVALLPFAERRCVVVLAVASDSAPHVLALDDDGFLALLQARFGQRLGRFLKVGTRHAYPLALTQAERQHAPRTAIIGNAAQGLHPIAGQGFNLGLRDAATLAEVIADALSDDPRSDLGAQALLERYSAWRARDRRALVGFTDGLVRLFASPLAPLRLARRVGLAAFDLLPPAHAALSRLSTGFAGRIPRLARGLPLRGGSP
jgi:2-octaprenyl-6-methoxyphenol hydroxylase